MGHSHQLPSLGMQRDSHTISKTKPKIRIIHIFAPEIIKTDAENFRELVQKLTGKPSGEKNKKASARREEEYSRSISSSSGSGLSEDSRMMKTEVRNGGFWGRVKEEIGASCSDDSSSGYLGAGFSDFEGFISEIGEFPLLPLDSTHMQGFEEPQLL
ncbi:hypothetical protein SESBI_12472 [Sesbania bispinosa]|nr:hypothetical protein SESBI_12472 [Sesbania bispinosa]